MAVVTLRMALDPVHPAPTATGRITFTGRSPAMAARYPANFRLAHRALEPIAAPFLHYYHLRGSMGKREDIDS